MAGSGILAYGAYVPFWRLERSAIAGALGSGGGRGARAVASYDEDATTMAVEAARVALAGLPEGGEPGAALLATTAPPYLDKTNAVAVHAALRLDGGALAADMAGSVRSGVAATLYALTAPIRTLVCTSDLRTGLPSSADERDGGDAAAAVLIGPGTDERPVLAEFVAHGSATEEFLDRWRLPGELASRTWEDRFGEFAYVPLAEAAVTDALKSAGISAADVDHVVVTGVHARAVGRVRGSLGARKEAFVDDLTASVGNTGTAHPNLLLASVLDRAEPGRTILQVVLADGADAIVWRTTDAIVARRPDARRSVAAQAASGRAGLSYADFLSWRGLLDREPPRRPDPDRPGAPPGLRNEAWKYGFVGNRCNQCGSITLPPHRVCPKCRSVDQATPIPMADRRARIVTFTIDQLAFTPSPPLVGVIVDFEGGGRFNVELTDCVASEVAIGQEVEMTFRRIYTSALGSVHNYFWKARPVRDGGANDG
jgi:hydroxymethylglutaryl-CoA synthase